MRPDQRPNLPCHKLGGVDIGLVPIAAQEHDIVAIGEAGGGAHGRDHVGKHHDPGVRGLYLQDVLLDR